MVETRSRTSGTASPPAKRSRERSQSGSPAAKRAKNSPADSPSKSKTPSREPDATADLQSIEPAAGNDDGTAAAPPAETPGSSATPPEGSTRYLPKNARDGRVRGLINKGNWCYRSALFQCLLNQPAFCDMLDDDEEEGEIHQDCTDGYEVCVVCALKQMVWEYWDQSTVEGKPKPLDDIVDILDDALVEQYQLAEEGTMGHDIANYKQGCSFEFLTEILIPEMAGPEYDPNVDTPRVHKLLKVVYEMLWEPCRFCKKKHEETAPIVEPGLDVKIDHPMKGLALSTYLEATLHLKVNAECLCEESFAYYHKHQKWPERTHRKQLTGFPEILCIRLQRFAQKEGTKKEFYKIDDVIQYDEYLNLGPYTKSKEDVFYRLDGIVAHKDLNSKKSKKSKNSLENGHYIAVVRGLADGDFHFLDDGKTTTFSKAYNTAHLLQDPGFYKEFANFTPYILVYSRH